MRRLIRVLRLVGRETAWWVAGAARLVWRYPGWALLLALYGAVCTVTEAWRPFAVLAGLVLAVALWARVGPVSYGHWVGRRVWRWRTKRRVRKTWPVAVESVGLVQRIPVSRLPVRQPSKPGAVAVPPLDRVLRPRVGRLRWRSGQLVAAPRLLIGQTVDDVDQVAERLRVAMGAHRCRVEANAAQTACWVWWLFGDPLVEPFHATIPDPPPFSGAVLRMPPGGLDRILMGRREDGQPWVLDLRVSTLGAGSSGAGKASLIWSVLFALGPAIRSGLVEVAGIDLKGGMELAMGRPLLTWYADTAEQAVALLEDRVTALRARTARLAGTARLLEEPTAAEPLVLVVVDELAALVAYSSDRDLTKRADAALRLLLTQGRAVGFYVYGFLQDPRKETVAFRHLFGQTIGLRLREREETVMVLGEGAVAAGAACHKIPRALPGVGYVAGEAGRPVRVRAGHVTDQAIRTAAQRFPAPRPRTVEAKPADQGDDPSTARPRAPRKPRSSTHMSSTEEAA